MFDTHKRRAMFYSTRKMLIGGGAFAFGPRFRKAVPRREFLGEVIQDSIELLRECDPGEGALIHLKNLTLEVFGIEPGKVDAETIQAFNEAKERLAAKTHTVENAWPEWYVEKADALFHTTAA